MFSNMVIVILFGFTYIPIAYLSKEMLSSSAISWSQNLVSDIGSSKSNFVSNNIPMFV